MSDQTVIKRNRNRRLYSAALRRYVTLADVDQLIQSGTEFRVINAEDQNDTTYLTLLEVLKDRAKAGQTKLIAESELLKLLRTNARPAPQQTARKRATQSHQPRGRSE
jgi:polyhydroxyalkanoate synthesis repressor PhaR